MTPTDVVHTREEQTPAPSAGASRRRGIRWLAGVVIVVVAAILVPLLGENWIVAMTAVYFTVYICIAWNVIAGFGGQFALGQPLFLGIGAYTSTMLFMKAGVSPWLGMLAGAVISGAVAAGFGYLAFRFRVRGLYFGLLTFASLVVAQGLATTFDWIGGAAGLILPLGDDTLNFVWRSRTPYYYVILAFAVLAAVLSWWLARRTRFGWRLDALRHDEDAAAAIGVDVPRAKIQAFVISAMLTAAAGTFYAQFYELVSPDTVLTFDTQIDMLVGTIIGGLATVGGPIVGGLLVGGYRQLLTYLPLGSHVAASVGELTFAVFLIVVSIWAPGGIVGLRPWRALTRRKGVERDDRA